VNHNTEVELNSEKIGKSFRSAKVEDREPIIFISSFPRRRNRSIQDLNAVAWYMGCLAPKIHSLLVQSGRRLVVLAEQLPGEPAVQREEGILILRCWKRGSMSVFAQIMLALRSRFPSARVVVVQFEFNVFGGVLSTAGLPAFLASSRILGLRTFLVIHQVVDDLGNIRSHVGLDGSPVRFALWQRLLKLFYRMLILTAKRTIVTEDLLKMRLRQISRKHVKVIPLGSSSESVPPRREEARRSLGFPEDQIILLAFGFLAHYKDSDWIGDEMIDCVGKEPESPFRLVLAGGGSPNHQGQPYYEKFLDDLRAKAGKHSGIIRMTGYVPEQDIPLLFRAADVAVFPYRTHMSASGALSLAFSFGAPFILSRELRHVLSSEDFQEPLREAALAPDEVTFELRRGRLIAKVKELMADPRRTKLNALRLLSERMGERRSWATVASQYVSLLENDDEMK
jgi:glycosyltransferase involved in cell wall biosynthesis